MNFHHIKYKATSLKLLIWNLQPLKTLIQNHLLPLFIWSQIKKHQWSVKI